MSPIVPMPRGPLSAALFDHWSSGAPLLPSIVVDDPLSDDDLHLALWCCHNLFSAGFEDVPDDMEWDPDTIAFRTALEATFEAALRMEHRADDLPTDPTVAIRVIGSWAGPPLAATVERDGDRWQLEEVAIHRSAYQLKEADPHTWAIPRIAGPGRAAMIEIQSDEYGRGVPGEAHHELFAAAMTDLGLDPEFGHYLEHLPGTTLATDNLVSMFGLRRRLRGALVGHLALFETTSVTPMSRYLSAARRVGPLPALERFYEVHVEADAHHGSLALSQMVAPFVAANPQLAADVIFGAAALSRVETRFAHHILRSWNDGRSSLRSPSLVSVASTMPTEPEPEPRPVTPMPARRAVSA